MVDTMTDEELDQFIEEQTGVNPNDDLSVVEEESSTTEEEETTTEEEVSTDVEEETPIEEEPNTEEESISVSLDGYKPDELSIMTEVYDDLFKNGIKASGVNRTVRDAEHLKTLVRIGLSANENNRRIKPYLKQLRSLEQAGIELKDDNLNFLVDVMSGNKEAIKELVLNKAKIDEDTLQSWMYKDGEETPSSYTPKNHLLSDAEFKLTETLEDIKSSSEYSKTIDFLSNLDDDGKGIVNKEPEVVKLINNDMESGIFEKALDEAYFRMDRGLLPKQSILKSYIAVMQDENFYESLHNTVTPNKEEVVNRKKKVVNNGNRVAPKSRAKKQITSTAVNKMSQEEFDKFYNSLGIDD